MKICELKNCTGCGACKSICHQNAIYMQVDAYTGSLYPYVNDDKCVNCNLCKTVCPNVNFVKLRPVEKSLAAFSNDQETWRSAASGGIASEIYKFAIRNKWFVMATKFERTKGVYFRSVECLEDLSWACSSKYVHSNMVLNNVYYAYRDALMDGKKAIFIGLPCQCAGLINFLKILKTNLNNLYTVSIVCHGVPNWEYLKQHLSNIEHKTKKTIDCINFRNKKYDYRMKLFSEGQLISNIDMHNDETYANPFMNNLSLRENCFHCLYARPERCSDLTIGDYDGIALEPSYTNPNKQISCILISTDHGYELIENINTQIWTEERPIREPNKYNEQLNHPSRPNKKRDKFLEKYKNSLDYEYAIDQVFWYELKYKWKFRNLIIKFKEFIKRHLSVIYVMYKKSR